MRAALKGRHKNSRRSSRGRSRKSRSPERATQRLAPPDGPFKLPIDRWPASLASAFLRRSTNDLHLLSPLRGSLICLRLRLLQNSSYISATYTFCELKSSHSRSPSRLFAQPERATQKSRRSSRGGSRESRSPETAIRRMTCFKFRLPLELVAT